MKQVVWFLAGMLAASVATAECAPPKLVRITTVNATPGIKRTDFAARPKTFYRVGNGRTRLEEQRDPKKGVEMLLISDAPKAWVIDLAKKTGQMVVDDSSPPVVVAAVFSDETVPKRVQDALEFGCEDEFIANPETTHETREVQGKKTVKHSREFGVWRISVSTQEDSGRPFAAVLSLEGKVVGAIAYVGYETFGGVPEGFFAPPAGVEIKPAK